MAIVNAAAKAMTSPSKMANFETRTWKSDRVWIIEVTKLAHDHKLVLPITVEISGATTIGCAAKEKVGQLAGRAMFLLNGGAMSDGTPDRLMHSWVVRASLGTEILLTVRHPRCGEIATTLKLN